MGLALNHAQDTETIKRKISISFIKKRGLEDQAKQI